MNPQVPVPLWILVVTPVATILGTMLAVMVAALFQNRAVDRMGEALRAEVKQALAELELRLTKQIMEIAHRVERLEEQRGLVRP